MRSVMRSFSAARISLAIALCTFVPASGAAGSEDDGWVSLFDGRTLDGWVLEDGKAVAGGWVVEDGALYRKSRAGSIITKQQYLNFELEFEWKIASGGNSGVKYRLHQIGEGSWLGPEYQILDDALHRDARDAATSTAALYLLKEPGPEKKVRPAGEFNLARIAARGTVLEHWLNGSRVLTVDTSSAGWRQTLALTKYIKAPGAQDWFARQAGPIMLQDHGSSVWFRSIRIRELK